jgi:hypothetical protein
MAEVLDFLRELRAALGPTRLLHVLPVGATSTGAPTNADARHLDLWRRVLGGLGDPALRVARIGKGDA